YCGNALTNCRGISVLCCVQPITREDNKIINGRFLFIFIPRTDKNKSYSNNAALSVINPLLNGNDNYPT
ncbi:hypothetical protein DLS94_21265, partial [Shigella sonnei]|nr:hypothetical protein [Shigella sonnei]